MKTTKPTGKTWKPEIGKRFWCVEADNIVTMWTYTNGRVTAPLVESNNYFRTKALALAAAKKIKALLKTLPHE